MVEDNKVSLGLVRPFLHTADAIIQVKSKELNLGVKDDRITFLIDKAMQHSHSNDDTCFCIDDCVVVSGIEKAQTDETFVDYKSL
nr:reverse transcriptase domain-containing protein [Tanacetum cinerariifolium]